jgi:hypothetical protein
MHHKTLCVVFPLALLQRQQKDEWIGLCPYSAIIDYKIFIARKIHCTGVRYRAARVVSSLSPFAFMLSLRLVMNKNDLISSRARNIKITPSLFIAGGAN